MRYCKKENKTVNLSHKEYIYNIDAICLSTVEHVSDDSNICSLFNTSRPIFWKSEFVNFHLKNVTVILLYDSLIYLVESSTRKNISWDDNSKHEHIYTC